MTALFQAARTCFLTVVRLSPMLAGRLGHSILWAWPGFRSA
jgi:hypothetical protein